MMRFPERRQHVRIVTLRNFAWVTLAMLLGFAAISLRSELRGRHMHDYGRLVDHQIDQTIERKPVAVVEESAPPPQAQASSEAMVVVPVDAPPAQPAPVLSSQIVPPAPVRGDRVSVVGGPEGVTIVQHTGHRLRGGFGR